MKSSAPILYCHCAHAAIVPAEVKQAVLAGLAASGAAVEAVADLCELAARRDPSLKRFAAGGGHIIACHPRAVRWLFAWAGAALPKDAVIHNMRTQGAEAILATWAAARHARPRTRSKPPAAPVFPAKRPGEWMPWFPVIDYDRCQDCRQCAEFCLFGVYAADEGGKVRVVQPDKCKTNCPACARVCPASAIIFPKYKEGPISGDVGVLTDVDADGLKADLSALAGDGALEALRRRAARARAAAEAKRAKESPAR